MFQKPCSLLKASIAWMGGGGGSTQVESPYGSQGGNRTFGEEKQKIKNFYNLQQNELRDFRANDPFLSVMGPQVTDWFKNRLPEMLGQFPGFGKELEANQGQLRDLYGDLGGYREDLGGISQRLGGMIPGVQGQIARQQGQLGDIYGQLGGIYGAPGGPAGIIASGGALTPGLARDVAQQTRGIAAAQGGARSTGALGQELLNRDAYREARLGRAQQTGAGLLGQQAGVTGQQSQLTGLGTQLVSGLLGQQAGITQGQAGITGMQQANIGQQAGLTGQRANLLGQEQALQTGGLNQMLGVSNAGVSQFGSLTNPALAYLGQLFGGNQQAQIAQAQIGAQQQAAGDAAKAGTTSSGIGAAGSLIGAIGMIAL